MKLIQKFMSLTPFEKCVVIVMLFVFVGYGGSKAPTNQPPQMMTMMMSTPHCPPPPLLSTSISNWMDRGAWCDWKRLRLPDGFRFPCGTNYLTEITLLSQGAIRTSLTNAVALAQFPEPLAIEPNATTVSYGLTPSNTFLISWENACANRVATNRVNASLELFESGVIALSLQPTNEPPTISYQLPRPPEGFVGEGQNEDWIRANFPEEAENILALGYDNWVAAKVGINEANDCYQAAITIEALPTNGAPCYLVCGPYKVNVTAPGTYRFPLLIFETYEARTYPEAVALSATFDDGYRGEGESYEIEYVSDEPPTPRLLMAAAPLMASGPRPTDKLIRWFLRPKAVVSPQRIRLESAAGTEVSVWCKAKDLVFDVIRGIAEIEYQKQSGSQFVILQAYQTGLYEVESDSYDRYISGEFYIYSEPLPPEVVDPVRTDGDIFVGNTNQEVQVRDDLYIRHLTAVTHGGPTETNTVSWTVQTPEDVSVYVGVFLASSEPYLKADIRYDDDLSWEVWNKGVKRLEGNTGVLAHANEILDCESEHRRLEGIKCDPIFLCGMRFDPDEGESLTLTLRVSARNARDNLRESCVQLAVFPIDADGQILGLPEWAW